MSDVGHELRTPLTILRGTLEMTDEHDPGDVREAHRIALDELDRMGRVVGDLSELAAATRPDYVTLRPLDMAAFARSDRKSTRLNSSHVAISYAVVCLKKKKKKKLNCL